MALIIHYDATKLDQKQLNEEFKETDHHLEFVGEKIEPANCNAEAEVISVFVSSTITREVIEAMPKLKLIALRSTGFNNVDFEAAKEHDITVVNVPFYGNETVAEFVFTMLLALTRKLQEILEAENKQFSPDELTGSDLHGKVFGSLGTGNIGQKSLKIADGFSMKTIAYDAFPKEELQDELNFDYVELDELLEKSDVLSIHVPYLSSTHHIMNRENLNKMKPGAILINTARGELVDTGALIELLDSGYLGGACIDVIEGETLLNHINEIDILRNHANTRGTMNHSIEIDVLKKMPNVIISPHNAYNTVEAIARINGTTAKNIIDYWYGDIPNEVIPPKKPPGKLIIMRHGESEWNATGQWTGITDVHLSEKGFRDTAVIGQAFKELNIDVDIAYVSNLIRARETLEIVLDTAQQFNVESIADGALNERDYGKYTGKNKWEVKEEVGDDRFNEIRRGWDVEIPDGESLKMVYERAIPFYKEIIVPAVSDGKNVLIVAHGNTNRALKKYIESISDENIGSVEIDFNKILVYDVDEKGLLDKASVVEADIDPPNA